MAGKRVNLSPNPSCKNNTTGNATDWTSSPSGYARQTGLTGMDRTTGFGGSGARDIITSPRFAVTAGLDYVVSVQVKTGASNTFKMLVNWYAGTASGSFISNSGTSVPFTVNGTSRCEIGPVTAPTGAGGGYLRIIEVDSTTASFTALIAEQTSSTGRVYFDGDSTSPFKASWAGTAGNSESYELTAADTVTWSESGTKTVSAVGPVGADAFSFSSVGSVVASSTVTDPVTWADSGLIVGLTYDARYGRNRITAHGLPSTAIRAIVEVRPAGKARFTAVRGGKVGMTAGAFTRTVDDYEFAAGVANTYRITAYSTAEGVPDIAVATATATQAASNPGTWLKFIAQPSLNVAVQLVGFGEISRASRTALFDVQGRSDPIAVSDVASSRRVTVSLRTDGVTAADRLDYALSQGVPLFLHVPNGMALPSLYAVAGDYSSGLVAQTSQVRHWTLPLTEVAPPATTISGAAITCQTILDTYLTCDEVLDAFDTCQEMAG